MPEPPCPPWCACMCCEPVAIAGCVIHMPIAPGPMPAAAMPPSCAVSDCAVRLAKATTSDPATAGTVSGVEVAALPLRPTDEEVWWWLWWWWWETEPRGGGGWRRGGGMRGAMGPAGHEALLRALVLEEVLLPHARSEATEERRASAWEDGKRRHA